MDRKLRDESIKACLNGGGHHTITKTGILRTVPVEGHGDDPPHSFHDIPHSLSS
jgi:hypothetical protein